METTRPPGFPGNPPARMPRAPTPARSPPPRPLRCGEIAFRPTHDVGPHKQCISGLNHAAYGLPVNASRPGSPQAHASLGSGWRPTLAGWDWIPTGFRTRFQRSHHGILSPLTGLSRHTRCCMVRPRNRSDVEVADDHAVTAKDWAFPSANILFSTVHPTLASRCCASNPFARRLRPRLRLYRRNVPSTRACCR